ncbi:hypothetical protein ALC56_09480 [Trachymyrmex septentrionalis]|uniref:Uncharacterized protein n=1 Tax=Trachymyrmex septentrionalis TaxID=34720 RepID=A0A151JUC9_9HYME|nr:hypothetical protein ALC56_09480 [Trachymyrmex septentrionalis]
MPTFVDLQGFIVNKKFIVKEVAVLKQGTVLTHYIFTSPVPWKFLTRSDRSCASWLSVYHGLRWEDGMIYNEAKRLITTAVFEDDAIVYVKGREKRTWLQESLTNLDVTNTMRCGQHVKNCALQNVLKIYNWWLQKNFLNKNMLTY